ncbi:MAG: type II toxin-antitoxin system RelE/ParE family toxin [Minicystis sp.]
MSAPRRGKKPAAPRYQLLWTRRAEADLEAIGDYIAADNPIAAERWVGKLIEKARAAGDAPLAGRMVPEIRLETVREVFLRTYRLVYRVRGDVVVMLTIFEGHRRFPSDVDEDDEPEDP